jgi:hypothetical protein
MDNNERTTGGQPPWDLAVGREFADKPSERRTRPPKLGIPGLEWVAYAGGAHQGAQRARLLRCATALRVTGYLRCGSESAIDAKWDFASEFAVETMAGCKIENFTDRY